MHRTTYAALALFAGSASALTLTCAVDARTDAHQCVAKTEIQERDGIRSAPLYQGGPKGAERTSFTVAANCTTKVLHLKDRQGVSFSGGSFYATDMSKQLGEIMCNATMLAPKKKA